jgi:hypothetical protein
MHVLAGLFFKHLYREENAEYGGWGLNNKRPFGNSDPATDILEELGVPRPEDGYPIEFMRYAHELYDSLGDWLRDKWENNWSLPTQPTEEPK